MIKATCFFVGSELSVLCPKELNMQIAGKDSKEYLGISWLVIDAFVILTSMVSSVFLLSAFLSTHMALLVKTSVYSSLSFVFVETSNSSMIFVKFAIAALHKLYFLLNSTLVYLSLVMRTTKNMYFFIVLISSPSEKCLLLHIGHYCRIFMLKLRPVLSLLF